MSSRSKGCQSCLAEVTGKLPGRGRSRVRQLDRYLGIPLVFLAGQCRPKRSLPVHPKRIGLLNTAAVGDTILMSGPVADLRDAYAHAEIVLLSGPSNYDAACLLDGVDEVIELQPFNPLAAIRRVRELKIDLFLDFGPWCRLNAIIAICSGADFIAGFRTSAQGRHFAYDLVVDHSRRAHELENHRGLVRALGILPSHPPALHNRLSENQNVHDFSRRFAVFHLWPGGAAAQLKQWPLGRWVALAEDFAADDYDVVFTGSANQRALNELAIREVKLSIRHRMRNLAGSSLRETMRLLSRADLVVSVDTGVMHMAAALGTPLVALHGPSSARRWGPVSEKALVVESTLGGCGFLNLGFENSRHAPPCMNAISYGQVRSACNAALRLRQPKTVMSMPGQALSAPDLASTPTVGHLPRAGAGG